MNFIMVSIDSFLLLFIYIYSRIVMEMVEINKDDWNSNESQLMELSEAYNDYFQAYNELCKHLTKSHMSLLKGILSIKLTERDEIKFELFENKRLSLYKINIDQKNDLLDLDIESIIPTTKNKVNSKDNRDDNNNNNNILINRNKIKDEKTSEIIEEIDTIKVIDPIKLIHGGFIPLSLRNSQKDSNLAIFSIINVINKKIKLIKLLDKFDN